jgi:CheY-like chemotaxis protein
MLLIDHDTETHLTAALKAHHLTSRYLYLHLMDAPPIVGIKEKVIETAKRLFEEVELQMYFCEDGDICLLAPLLPRKAGNQFVLEIAAYAGRIANDSFAQCYDVMPRLPHLLALMEQKRHKKTQAHAHQVKLEEQQQRERKRQAILGGNYASPADVKARRAARATPQMMMIEDDPFSRRLVENVIQKKYPLTGLGEATHALETYARLAPDILFLDIQLPDVTGHELLEKIIALDPEAYVVMLSGNADRDNITQAMQRGAKGFIAKPFTREKLFQYIERCPTLPQMAVG